MKDSGVWTSMQLQMRNTKELKCDFDWLKILANHSRLWSQWWLKLRQLAFADDLVIVGEGIHCTVYAW